MSKLLTSPALYTSTNRWGDIAFAGKFCLSINSTPPWWFCASDFREHFDVPETATKVWLEFHTLPAASRYKAEVTRIGYTTSVSLDGKYVPVISRVAEMIARKLKTDECYVECYYE